MTTITLPKAVDDFVTATNTHDSDALLAVFAPGAVVIDDGTSHVTRDAIRQWLTVHQIGPRIVITPISFTDGRLIASVDGDFPGGPLTFAFDFALEGDLVTELAIQPA